MTLKAFLVSLAWAVVSAAVGYSTVHFGAVTGVDPTYATIITALLGIVSHWLPTPPAMAAALSTSSQK